MNEPVRTTSAEGASHKLRPADVRVGTPLAWPVVDTDGALLFGQGTTLIDTAEREFLFKNFQPQRGDLPVSRPVSSAAGPTAHVGQPITPAEMKLGIGALLGLRPQIGMGRAMHSSRVIGFAPHQALFVTPPWSDGQPVPLARGEQVEVVAIASHAVFWFVCTVDAVCRDPFSYLVLSPPGTIRRLRERRAQRVPVRLAVRYGTDVASASCDSVGVARDLSVLGMSLAAFRSLGEPGEHLCVAFRLRMDDTDVEIQTAAVIRNVHWDASKPGDETIHGLEFASLQPSQQTALKNFVFDRQDVVSVHGPGLTG
ncbi:flagellar brake protein [Paraburkholderia sp. Ac-20342]|uniref:flagellar brake protein n=1 Tax=Paraburkholderia sp. Ac-20342 TaxID=2703889 RepID=UPI00197DE2A7|nr:flagellar brake protein [Paraburkholderia sp. Ac-20342]MBN3851673.1 flagellar brake protein [Paraburkholderia sp. Ac-20342]